MAKKNRKLPQKKAKDELTGKQKKFAREYFVDFNGTQAAIRAGYAKRSAGQEAGRLLKNVKVQAEMQKIAQRLEEKGERTLEEHAATLEGLSYAEITDLVTWDERGILSLKCTPDQLPPALKAAISEIWNDKDGNLRVRLHPKLKAFDMLLKMKGGYAPEKWELDHTVGQLTPQERAGKALGLLDTARARRAGGAAGG